MSFRGSSENQFRRTGVNVPRDSVASCRGSSTPPRIISFTVFLFLLIQMSPENFLFTRMRLDTLNGRSLASSILTRAQVRMRVYDYPLLNLLTTPG